MSSYDNDTQLKPFFNSLPEGRLAIVPLASMTEIGDKVNQYLVDWRKQRVLDGVISNTNGYYRDSYLIHSSVPRFGSGEAKGQIRESIRGDDVYFMVDVMNYSLTYEMAGHMNSMGPDDHFADLKRLIAAAGRKARHVNVIMPYLYEGRQLNVSGRESQDCASALKELVDLGVDNIITFDAHDARVQNAIPLSGFETVSPTYQFLKNVLRVAPDMKVDSDHLMIISPDVGGMRRAVYLANVLGVDMGMFYKRMDYTVSLDSHHRKHPVVSHEFLGSDVEGKDLIILDDMISSGESVLETAELLKKKNAGRIFICATFGVLTNGIEPFDIAFDRGVFDKLITTNLIYQPKDLLSREYYASCDMSKFIALIIDTLNHDCSLSSLLNPIDRINRVIAKHNAGEPV